MERGSILFSCASFHQVLVSAPHITKQVEESFQILHK